jgi:hypothetical protein
MAAPQVTGRKIRASPLPLLERAAYTIREFCDAHRISKSTYYNLRKTSAPTRHACGTG